MSDALLAALSTKEIAAMQKDTYTINFNNISMLEFLRFASKISNLNFIFEDADLQFNVSVISEEPVTAKNVMAALAQVLRIHDLILLEQEGNVLITKSTRVAQVPPIIAAEQTEEPPPNALLVTRVFRIKNANPNTLATILRPFTSDTALIEVSAETRQLLITDIAVNVEQIGNLLMTLDSPHSSLEIDMYTAKVVSPEELISLTQQILSSFTEGNPLSFVAQKDTNAIFIVSTPHLIERAMTIMEDLDIPPKEVIVGKEAATRKNVFIYKVLHRSPQDIISELKGILAQMKQRGSLRPGLKQAIEGVEEAENTNSLIFLADEESLVELKNILTSLDMPTSTNVTYFVYKLQRAPQDQIKTSLMQLRDKLKASSDPDVDLIKAIDSMQWSEDTSSLIFTGRPAAIDKLKELLPTFDIVGPKGAPKSTFLIYTPQNLSGDELYQAIENTRRNLKDSGLANPSLLQTLTTMKWMPSTNSLLFTGDAQSLERIHAMLTTMDTSSLLTSKASEVFIYKPQFASPDQILSALQSLVPALEVSNSFNDQLLIKAIQDLKWNPETQTFTVTAAPITVERLKTLLASFDTPQSGTSPLTQTFFLYKLQHVKGDVLINELKQVAAKIPSTSFQSKNLLSAIENIEWLRSKNSLLITGSPDAIDQIKALLADFDVPSGTELNAQNFYIYKPQNLPAEELLAVLIDLGKELQTTGLKDPQLLETISTARYVPATNSLILAGSPESIDKVKTILSTIDVIKPSPTVQTIGNFTFLLYKIQHASAEQFMASLRTFSNALQKSNASDAQVAAAIEGMKYIRENNSVLFTGPESALQRIEAIALKFDVGTGRETAPSSRGGATFVIYNPKYLTGEDLIGVMCDFMDHLIATGISNPELFDTINNLKWIPKTSTLLISGTKDSIAQVQDLLDRFDIPTGSTVAPSIQTFDNTSFLVYKLQFHTGVDIQSALKQIAMNLSRGNNANTILSEAIDSLQWIQPTNSLIATGPQDVLIKIKELIQNIDVPLRQVFIEILVLETSLIDTQSFGLQWGSQLQYFNKTVLQTGNFPNTTAPSTNFGSVLQPIGASSTLSNTTIPFPTSGFDLGVVGDIIMHKGRSFLSLGSLLTAIQTDSDTVVVINQKIVTQDNRQSTIFVGQNVPYTGSLVTNQTNSTLTTANIEYRDVGVNLTITPILGEGDDITLDIIQDISSIVGGAPTVSNTDVTGITTNHAHMETRVTVPDNKFLALTGLINDTKQYTRTAIPCLGSLPVIGLLFSQNTRADSKGPNFIIFVRPKIINSIEDYKKITEHQEWLFKNETGFNAGKEQFDAGLDLVKLPEDE